MKLLRVNICLSECGDIAHDFFQEHKEFLTVDIVLKTELAVIIKYLRENLIGHVLFRHHLIVSHQLNEFLSFFVECNVRHLFLISWYNKFNRFFYPALVEQHISRFSVRSSQATPRAGAVRVLRSLLFVSEAILG